jgi:hypothetical protein
MQTLLEEKEQPITAVWRNGGCSASYDSFVVGSSAVLRLNFCAKNPPLRQAAKRYVPFQYDISNTKIQTLIQTMMKNILGLLLLATFGLTSCNNNQSTTDSKPTLDAKTEIGKVNEFLKQFEEPSQIFKITADKPTQVKGKQGTIISINPTDLVTENRQPVGKNIEVELKELTNQEQLLRTNAQTTSNGQLLVSGGAYFINMTSDGQQLKLIEGKSLSVEFPKIATNEMSLFYGQRDTLGQLNWQQAEQRFENKPNPASAPDQAPAAQAVSEMDALLGYIKSEGNRPLTKEEKEAIEEQKKNSALADKVYKAIEVKQFGWINCDRFYEVPNKTNLQFAFNKKDSIVSAIIYLVFEDINSVMQNGYFSFDNKEYNSGFQNIPVGAKTQLIAFSIKNGKTYTYKSDLTIKPNETIQLTLNETSQDQIGKLFQSN